MEKKQFTAEEMEALFFDLEQGINEWILSKPIPTVNKIIYNIFGIPRGGIPVAYRMAGALNMKIVDKIEEADIVVDDIVDSGKTMDRYLQKTVGKSIPFFVLYNKKEDDPWIIFPWEENLESSADDIVTRFLQVIGEDVKRSGLKDTPERVIKSWSELYKGYTMDPQKVLDKRFQENYDEMVILKDIEFYSTCEHHLQPFFGKVHIAYIPAKERQTVVGDSGGYYVIGVSKLARLVECFSRRLQIQERLTQQIADAIQKFINPLGVAVCVEAQHLCMLSRGVQKQNSKMITSAMIGVFRDKPEARMEFLLLVNRK